MTTFYVETVTVSAWQRFGLKSVTVKFNIILNSVRQHNHFITQGNYNATCFDYRLVILTPILSIVSQDVHSIL